MKTSFINLNNWNASPDAAATDPFKTDKDGVEESSMKTAGFGGFGYVAGMPVGQRKDGEGKTEGDIQEVGCDDKMNKEEAKGHDQGC